MCPAIILKKNRVFLACLCLPLCFLAPLKSTAQVTVFSENFDGTVQPYTTAAAYTNANCSNYITPDNTLSSICGGEFCCSPDITDATGGNFLFEGTTMGPNYAGAIYQITINGTMVAGNVFTVTFNVWLANNTNPPVLVPQLNGANAGSPITPSSTTGWQTLTFTYTPAANISNPVFSIYNAQSNGIGNDFGLDDILVTTTVPTGFILALDFTGFSASSVANKTMLSWQMGPGGDADHFTVQQSTDGAHFTNIAEVASTDQGSTYNYVAATNNDGLYYYRILAVDNDGHTKYSEIRTVAIDNHQQALQLLANPVVGGQLTLAVNTTTAATATIRIISTDGKILHHLSTALHAGYNSIDVDLRKLPRGIYIAQVEYNTRIDHVKFIIP
ncbi:T9SS type A sorting domain-containing protein [Puia dinghuensis]|uniref:Secretion system C-terminal sorting domain-containing protein n=1 Tax=Puia dinghuensis TaxID=1792502 RepID=A0A8J2UHM3_9BACT|nr:T9SS type A sorting domain-containing protein [Puia dinghuensis]GGB19388.1 hypothetical protein GCM10011511_48870 [Puia dinghuensis]